MKVSRYRRSPFCIYTVCLFLYDVEDVIKIRTSERGYDALQDESDLEDVATERAMVLAMYADVPGDYSLYIDDLGVSLETEAAKSQMKK